MHKGVCVYIYLFSTGLHVFIFTLTFPLHVLCVALSSRNKLPNPHHAPKLCPFAVCFSLLSFCLKPALSYHLRSLSQHRSFSPTLSPSPSPPSCEVCDLCNFILPVAGDISQSGSMNIDELIRSALSKGQTQRSLDPTAPLALPIQYTDMLHHPHPVFSSLSLSGQGLR